MRIYDRDQKWAGPRQAADGASFTAENYRTGSTFIMKNNTNFFERFLLSIVDF